MRDLFALAVSAVFVALLIAQMVRKRMATRRKRDRLKMILGVLPRNAEKAPSIVQVAGKLSSPPYSRDQRRRQVEAHDDLADLYDQGKVGYEGDGEQSPRRLFRKGA